MINLIMNRPLIIRGFIIGCVGFYISSYIALLIKKWYFMKYDPTVVEYNIHFCWRYLSFYPIIVKEVIYKENR